MTLQPPVVRRLCRRLPAFTVIELLVAVSILTVIVFILFKLFDQTQRAMRANMSQTDVMEGARAVTDMLGRELEQSGAMWSEWPGLARTNFFCSPVRGPFVLNLPGAGLFDTHYLDAVYFLTPFELGDRQQSHRWMATMYRVLARERIDPDDPYSATRTNLAPEGVGWLAKMSLTVDHGMGTVIDPLDPTPQGLGMLSTDATNLYRFQKVVDGVVHFRVRPLNTYGQPLYQRFNTVRPTDPILDYSTNQVHQLLTGLVAGSHPEIAYAFVGSALPAFVELEIGFLEPQAADKWAALPTPESRRRFLTNQAARVHYFTQRIPIHGAPKLLPR